jgi:hypothetical protein
MLQVLTLKIDVHLDTETARVAKQFVLPPLPLFRKRDKSTAYYPVGKMLAVRLLMSSGKDSQKHLKTMQGLIEYHDPETGLNLKMHDFYETSLVITLNEGSNYRHLSFIAEFIVPYSFVFDTVRLFHDNGLISFSGLDCVMIFYAPPETESRILEFEVTTIPDAEGHNVILQGLVVPDEGF